MKAKFKIGDKVTRDGLWKKENLTITQVWDAKKEFIYYCKARKNGKWISENGLIHR